MLSLSKKIPQNKAASGFASRSGEGVVRSPALLANAFNKVFFPASRGKNLPKPQAFSHYIRTTCCWAEPRRASSVAQAAACVPAWGPGTAQRCHRVRAEPSASPEHCQLQQHGGGLPVGFFIPDHGWHLGPGSLGVGRWPCVCWMNAGTRSAPPVCHVTAGCLGASVK